MDLFKKFLDQTVVDTEYEVERVENLAEIYIPNDVLPIVSVELINKDEYNIRFRMGIPLNLVADITKRMTLADSSIYFLEEFFIDDDYGYLYGDEGRQAFIEDIKKKMTMANISEETDGAFFMSHDPVIAFGSDTRNKYQKMWDEE